MIGFSHDALQQTIYKEHTARLAPTSDTFVYQESCRFGHANRRLERGRIPSHRVRRHALHACHNAKVAARLGHRPDYRIKERFVSGVSKQPEVWRLVSGTILATQTGGDADDGVAKTHVMWVGSWRPCSRNRPLAMCLETFNILCHYLCASICSI